MTKGSCHVSHGHLIFNIRALSHSIVTAAWEVHRPSAVSPVSDKETEADSVACPRSPPAGFLALQVFGTCHCSVRSATLQKSRSYLEAVVNNRSIFLASQEQPPLRKDVSSTGLAGWGGSPHCQSVLFSRPLCLPQTHTHALIPFALPNVVLITRHPPR